MAEDTVIYAADTEFGHYEVIDTIYGGRPARVLYSGRRQAAQSGLARDNKPELLFDYNERFMELVRGLGPHRVLLIGGGAFTLPAAIIKEFPGVELDVVELNGALVNIARDYFGLALSGRIQVYIADGVTYLVQNNKKYDLILLDVFADAVVPPVFQTPVVARYLAAELRDGGIVAMNIIAGYYGDRAAVLRRQITALQGAFADLQLFPAGREPSLWLPQNFILAAQNGRRDLQSLLRYERLALP